MARYFDMGELLGPLAINKDPLTGIHANQHMPIILGGAARYEVVQDDIFKKVLFLLQLFSRLLPPNEP